MDEQQTCGKGLAENSALPAQLADGADEMAAARDLPRGRHDSETMRSPEVGDAFRRYIQAKQDLLSLLQRMADQDPQLLAQMDS
jgi:hypothetical protein